MNRTAPATSSSTRPETVLRESMDFLVTTAVRAPSPHNTQPWRFRLRRDTVELLADRDRALPVVDPDHRELTIGCGAALYNLRLAVSSLGFEPRVTLLPDDSEPDLLARVGLGERRPPTDDEQRLLSAIPRRHTHRGAFEPREVPRGLKVELQAAAEDEGARLLFVEVPGNRRTLAELIEIAERTQQGDPAFRAELAAWTPEPDSGRRDGVPATAYPPVVDEAEFAMRDFAMGRGTGLVTPRRDPVDPVLLVIITSGDRPRDWLRAGQALQRVLLHAASHWVFASFLGQPTELSHLREAMRAELVLDGFPQLVLRLGYAPVAATTPRLPVQNVLSE